MKKVLSYFAVMMGILMILPLVIVRSCSLPEEKIIPEAPKKQMTLRVYFTDEKIIKEVPLEEYLKGVVAAEMPAAFEIEALKAQAVAARTYAYGRMKKIFKASGELHEEADICTDSKHCQAWISKKSALKNWGILSGLRYWNKISKAVKETENIIIVYQDTVINPVFHANSGGKTENAEEVWEGKSVPYLKSVNSQGEETGMDYQTSMTWEKSEFVTKLKEEYPEIKLNEKNLLKNIKIESVSEGGRVKMIKIGNISIKGTDFRRIFSLKSTCFSVEEEDDQTLKITTLGYGHGVGMSQWGANSLSMKGASFEEIIKWYYQGVELSAIKD